MQDIDFYTGQNQRQYSTQFDSADPEYFPKMSGINSREQERMKNRASRTIFLITAMCIISFTTGLAIGIKFAGGADKKIVDDTTYNAVKGLQSKVSRMMTPQTASAETKNMFPAAEYPFVISIGEKTYPREKSQEMATVLSSQGHRVILSKKDTGYRIYTGPYKNMEEAEENLKKLDSIQKQSLGASCRIIKRQ